MSASPPPNPTITEKSYPQWAREVRKEQPPASIDEYFLTWAAFFDHYALVMQNWRKRNAGYHSALASLIQFYVPKDSRVLELGSGSGDLLAAAHPRRGVGIDISAEMTRLARERHPHLEFHQMAAERLDLGGEKFDYVILSDLPGFLFDIRMAFERIRTVCHPGTRIIVSWHSRVWQPIITAAEWLGLKYPQPLLNWTTNEDLINLLDLADFGVVHRRQHILLPKRVPLLSSLFNRFLAHLPGIQPFCLTNWIVARPMQLESGDSRPTVSVICPCRNEAGNIRQIADRLPSMGRHTELIFVEGHSTDDTLATCRQVADENPHKDISVYVQEGRGKGDAVRLGFSRAKGDILMILDADISVAPEDLVSFYDALARGKGDFVNGCRLVYTMDPKAMRFLNLAGNRFFALLLSKLMGQPIKDSLCGTKVLWRRDYEELARNRGYFGEVDPFGDFDLLFGAAKLNLKIVEIPIRYRQRIYGSTNINRFADGWLLLRMSAKAAARLFFVA
jgi:ubiquinone/menaquinone biosynthesis C-methylase UbiE